MKFALSFCTGNVFQDQMYWNVCLVAHICLMCNYIDIMHSKFPTINALFNFLSIAVDLLRKDLQST